MAPRRRRQEDDDSVEQDAESGAIPSGGSTSGRTPIGVSEDYTAVVPLDPGSYRRSSPDTAERASRAGAMEIGPRYYEGDEFKPGQLSPAAIAELQRRMVEGGLLSGGFRLGVWDEASVEAYKELLGFANSSGLTDQEALSRYESAEQIGADEYAPLVYRQSNPDDLRQVFRSAVIEQLGQGWTREKVDAAVQAYLAEERRVQDTAYSQEAAGQMEITQMDVPDPSMFIERYVEERDPVGVQTRDTLDYVNEFMTLASSPGWGAR